MSSHRNRREKGSSPSSANEN